MPPQTCRGDSQVAVRPEHLNSPLILTADTTFVFVHIQQDLLIASHNKVRDVLLLCELSEFVVHLRDVEDSRISLLFCRKRNELSFTSFPPSDSKVGILENKKRFSLLKRKLSVAAPKTGNIDIPDVNAVSFQCELACSLSDATGSRQSRSSRLSSVVLH